jgi:predicted alpha/beta-fold hydrolase
VAYQRERWTTPDGDFIDVDWAGPERAARLLVLFHGLEGNSQSQYARVLAAEAQLRGWRFAVPHFRGCSGEDNDLARAYHAGDSDEIDWVLRRCATGYPALHPAGVSLGGNALLKWLGERGAEAAGLACRAAVISAPFRLTVTGRALERSFSRFYGRHFLAHDLRNKALRKIRRFKEQVPFDEKAVDVIATLRDFDDKVTGPLHGFGDAERYFEESSAERWLPHIRVPTLVLNAHNDPFLSHEVLREVGERELPDAVTLEFPAEGGHGGFPSGNDWLARRVLDFLSQA